MQRFTFRAAVLIVASTLAATITLPPITAQDRPKQQRPATRPAPGGGAGNKPGGGGAENRPPAGGKPGGGNRPNPGNGGGNRPNPGNGGGNRPNPGQGNPGNGGNRPGPGNGGGNRPGNGGGNRPGPGNGGNRPGGGGARPGGRPPQWGRPPQNRPSYNFRPNDRGYLQRYYRRNLGYVNRLNRPRFIAGGFFPYAYISYITALPPALYGYLPPPPPGYAMGYYDGYVVVYDPVSYFIANVIDLLS